MQIVGDKAAQLVDRHMLIVAVIEEVGGELIAPGPLRCLEDHLPSSGVDAAENARRGVEVGACGGLWGFSPSAVTSINRMARMSAQPAASMAAIWSLQSKLPLRAASARSRRLADNSLCPSCA